MVPLPFSTLKQRADEITQQLDYSLQEDYGVHLQMIDLLVQFHEKQIFDEVSIICSTEDIKVNGKHIQ